MSTQEKKQVFRVPLVRKENVGAQTKVHHILKQAHEGHHERMAEKGEEYVKNLKSSVGGEGTSITHQL